MVFLSFFILHYRLNKNINVACKIKSRNFVNSAKLLLRSYEPNLIEFVSLNAVK